MSVLRETTRVIVNTVLTRGGTIQETRDVTWEALPSQLPPPQPPLPIEIAEEGREESDDDVEAEVWPLAGRGIQHNRIRVNRDAVLPYCLLYTSPSPRDKRQSRMPSSA